MIQQNRFDSFFEKYNVKDLIPKDFKLIACKPDVTLPDALKLLVDKNVLSVPVEDPATPSNYLGFIDIVDILSFVALLTKAKELVDIFSPQPVDINDFTESENSVLSQMKVCDIITDPTHTQRTPWCAVWEGMPLNSLLDMFSKDVNLHRVAVTDTSGQVIAIISQSRVIQFLYEHMSDLEKLGITHRKVKSCLSHLPGSSTVHTVNSKQIALEAFMMLVQKNVSGIAVVDDNNVLVGCLSASDIKGSTYDKMFENIRKSVEEFMTDKTNRFSKLWPAPVAVAPDASLKAVLCQLAEKKIHRVFVVDEHKKPVGVISLCDLISFLHAP